MSQDSIPDTSLDEILIFRYRLMPCGYVLPHTDNYNRLLWYLDYATINVEAVAHTIQSSESLRSQFMQFEHMLKRVNKQEEQTGRLSGVRHIIDLNGYEINPFTMFFVTNGNLAYYSQLLHFENYPDLVTPMEMVNVPKWLHVPYKIAKTMMPDGFNDRFRLHDDNFLNALLKDINIEHIPQTLGGYNEVTQLSHSMQKIKTIPAQKLTNEKFWKPTDMELISALETFHISPRKVRQIHVDVTDANNSLLWYYSTDGDIYFGVFYQPFDEAISNNTITNNTRHEKEIDYDRLEMVYPWWKLAARIVHESGRIQCTKPGRYWFVFCNKLSWLQKRTVHLNVQLTDGSCTKRCHMDGTMSNAEITIQTDQTLHLSL
ncbi:unnamed protein product [Anisakis simplex]|uniref:CRAL-TRIO domain-containing protein n=2 Tax=Anisakis simplex TaxID=6269 RepID=A0A0M3J012_ANISI|nr:unnamed protein product [Anisakis simplex]